MRERFPFWEIHNKSLDVLRNAASKTETLVLNEVTRFAYNPEGLKEAGAVCAIWGVVLGIAGFTIAARSVPPPSLIEMFGEALKDVTWIGVWGALGRSLFMRGQRIRARK